jgi:hypothetical protein
MVVGAMGQVPLLSQFAEGVVFHFPAQMPDVPNVRPVVGVQSSPG